MVTETKKNFDVKMILSEIEVGIRRLLEENTRLRAQVTELSQPKEEPAQGKIVFLEEEVRKLRKMMEEYQNQEMTNRDRIFQIRKLIQEELNEKTAPVKEKGSPAVEEKTLKRDVKDVPDPLPKKRNIWDGEEEAGYSPYIATDEDEPIAYRSLEGEARGKDPFPSREEYKKTNGPASRDKEEEIENPPPQDPNKVYVEKPGLSGEEKPHSFLINDFAQEKDPFGDEDSKMDDDDFFKGRS